VNFDDLPICKNVAGMSAEGGSFVSLRILLS
jgi:hypothetical protein